MFAYPFPSFTSAVIAIMLAALFVLAWRFLDRLLSARIRYRFPDPRHAAGYSPVWSPPWTYGQSPTDAVPYQQRLLTLRNAAIDLAAHSSSSRARMREFKRIIGELLQFEEAHNIPIAALKTSTPTTRAE
jgi:hypothetical protein